MMTDSIFRFLQILRQTFCIHQYEGKVIGGFWNTRVIYKCRKCGRVVHTRPPKQLMYKEHKEELENENN